MCDVGINANTNAFSLILFNLPVLVVVQVVNLIGGYALVGRLPGIGTRRALLTVVVTIAIILAVAWLYFVPRDCP